MSGRVHNQGNTIGVQCESLLSDNTLSPWGTDRKWAQMTSPYAGMAFTVKGYMAKSQLDGNSGAALGNQVALQEADGSQTAPVKVNVGVGSGAANDTLKKAMEYAYAQSAWNLMNPGYNKEQGVQTEGDVTYQVF